MADQYLSLMIGSKAEIYLPRSVATRGCVPIDPMDGGLGVESFRVLVVEDNIIIGMLLAEMLTAMGHRVCGVEATEAGAVAAAARWHPDLMIVDAELKEGSGFQAISTILAAGPMPHVFMSGTVVSIGGPRSLMLHKPFGEKDLVRAIERVTRAKSVS